MSRFMALLVVVCLLGHSHVSWAQSVSGGIKAGVSAASLPGVKDAVTVSVDEERRWGGTGGVFVTVPLNDVVAFQPEALYVAKGAKLVAGSITLAFDINYLEVPLLFRFSGSNAPWYFLAGASTGFRLSAEGRETINGATETRDVSDQTKGVDFGLAFGAGASFNRFLIEGRWTEGLRDAASGDDFETAVRTRVFAVLAGFRF